MNRTRLAKQLIFWSPHFPSPIPSGSRSFADDAMVTRTFLSISARRLLLRPMTLTFSIVFSCVQRQS